MPTTNAPLSTSSHVVLASDVCEEDLAVGDPYVIHSRGDGEASMDEFGKAVGITLKEPVEKVASESDEPDQ